MGDRDKTPPLHGRARTQGVYQDADARASTASERAKRDALRATTYPHGVPVTTPTEDQDGPVTAPHELFEAALTDDEAETARRHNSPTDSPMNLRQGIKLAAHVNKHHIENKSAIAAVANTVLALEASTSPQRIAGIEQRLDAVEATTEEVVAATRDVSRIVRIVKWAVAAMAASGIGTLIAIGNRIWDRAEREGESTIRLKHVEDSLDQLRQDLRDDRSSRHYSPAPDHAGWLQPPTKDEVKP